MLKSVEKSNSTQEIHLKHQTWGRSITEPNKRASPEVLAKRRECSLNAAVEDYRNNRENGNEEDNPQYEFPRDGKYEWEAPSNGSNRVVYKEGKNDKLWMKEKDTNYLKRLGVDDNRIEKESMFCCI